MRALLVPIALGAFGVGLGRTLAMIASLLTARGWQVTVLAGRPLELERIEQRFGIPLADLEVRLWPAAGRPRGRWRRALYDRARHLAFCRLSRRFDLLWMQSPHIPPISLARRSILFTEFPFDVEPRALFWRRRLAAYDRIVANSAFTRGWIERYWGVGAGVFYPSVQECSPAAKEPSILAAGRFTGGERSKRQLELVRAYKAMVAQGLDGWPLHLAGIVEDPAYLAAVRREARGYDVRLHLDLDAGDLARLYGRSSIFWHATGLGADAERAPHALEHFGIVTAEAMTAGCVPVVFGRGGQAEIVRPGEGFTWLTPDELVRHTFTLVRDDARRRAMAEKARASAVERFGEAAFAARLDDLIGAGGS